MTAVQILASLGFIGSSVVNDAKGKVTVKAWTKKGWHYENISKEKMEDELIAMARRVTPGTFA